MRIALYGKSIDQNYSSDIKELFQHLDKVGAKILIHKKLIGPLKACGFEEEFDSQYFESSKDLSEGVDFLLSIGGDGTFLDTILLVGNLNIPVLGINMGRLGFLSHTSTSEIKDAIDALVSGDYSIEERSLLKLDSDNNLFAENNYALNEIAIMKRDSSSMITIHTELDGKHLNSYWTDGLIISTATGSTAYSLSCGGPILMPGSGNFVLTPIAPHNLNVRPIVVGDNSILKISVESRAEKNLVALDSRSKELENGLELTIQKAEHKISLVQLNNHSFLQSLRNKLSWGLDKRNK